MVLGSFSFCCVDCHGGGEHWPAVLPSGTTIRTRHVLFQQPFIALMPISVVSACALK
jgi:hypothetical protein